MKRLAALALVALVTACGSDPSPEDAVADASRELGKVSSGHLTLSVSARTTGEDTGPVGFSLDGPFSLAGPGSLPVARLDYTRMAGGEESRATFVSDGEEAFVLVGDERHPLDREAAAALRAPQGDGDANGDGDDDGGDEGASPLGSLALDEWITGARRVDGGDGDGNRYEGGVDAARFLADLSSLAAGLGAEPVAEPLPDADRDRLAALVEESRMAVVVGDDGVPRHVEVEVVLAARDGAAVPEALRPLAGVRLSMRMELRDVNEPVEPDG
jgi:hypothetical protein